MSEEIKSTATEVKPGQGETIANIVLEQEQTDGYAHSQAVEFTNKVFGENWKTVKGSEERYWVLYPQKQLQFSHEAFVPSTTNTGGTSARRDPIGKIFANPNFVYPLWRASNIYTSYRTYTPGMYANILLTNESVEKAQLEAQVNRDFEFAKSNQLLFGSDKIDANGNTRRYEGLADIVKTALGDGTTTYDVNTISLEDTTNTSKVIKYTPRAADANASMIEALAQLRTGIFKMKSLNTFFSYGKASDGSVPVNGDGMDIARKYVMVGNINLIETINGFNYTIFKNINEYFKVSEIEALPITTFDVSYKAGDDQMAGLQDVVSSINLGLSQVAIFDANALVKREFEITSNSKDFFTTNITDKIQKNGIFWSNYKINAPVMIFDFGTALDLIGLPTNTLNK